jgi:hypothetical protein
MRPAASRLSSTGSGRTATWSPPLPEGVERPGGSATPRSPIARAKTATADALPFGHPPSKVVIRARSTEPTQYTVKLGSGARRAIEDELALVHRELGPDYEAGGWLYGQDRPRESSTWTTIAVATHAGDEESSSETG